MGHLYFSSREILAQFYSRRREEKCRMYTAEESVECTQEKRERAERKRKKGKIRKKRKRTYLITMSMTKGGWLSVPPRPGQEWNGRSSGCSLNKEQGRWIEEGKDEGWIVDFDGITK